MLILAFCIGIVAGLRAVTALAAAAWAASGQSVPLPTPLNYLSLPAVKWIATVLALGELVSDKLPNTPSRKVPVQFGARLFTGGLAGAVFAAPVGLALPGLAAGIAGAVAGTYGGAAARGALAARFGKDTPAAIIEDIVAIGGALLILSAL